MPFSAETRDRLKFVLSTLALIWLVFILDIFLPLERFGIQPRTIGGLWGILFAPLLHLNLAHIMSNSLPLAVLLLLLSQARQTLFWRTAFLTSVCGGALLWLFGRSANHIGASIWIFALIAYLVVNGLFAHRLLSLVIAIGVAFVYGGTVLNGIVPGCPNVSWDGHLFGAIAGGLIAFVQGRKQKEPGIVSG